MGERRICDSLAAVFCGCEREVLARAGKDHVEERTGAGIQAERESWRQRWSTRDDRVDKRDSEMGERKYAAGNSGDVSRRMFAWPRRAEGDVVSCRNWISFDLGRSADSRRVYFSSQRSA